MSSFFSLASEPIMSERNLAISAVNTILPVPNFCNLSKMHTLSCKPKSTTQQKIQQTRPRFLPHLLASTANSSPLFSVGLVGSSSVASGMQQTQQIKVGQQPSLIQHNRTTISIKFTGNIHPLNSSIGKPNACLKSEHSVTAFYDKNCASNVSESRSSNSVFLLGERTLDVCLNAPKGSVCFAEICENPGCERAVCSNEQLNSRISSPALPSRAQNRATRTEQTLCAQAVRRNAPEKSECSLPVRASKPDVLSKPPSCPSSVCVHALKKTDFSSKHAGTIGVCQNATMKNSLFFNYTKCIKTTDPPINMNDEIKCTCCETKCPSEPCLSFSKTDTLFGQHVFASRCTFCSTSKHPTKPIFNQPRVL